MTDQAARIRTAYPYPIARAYAALDDPDTSLQLKQEALYFTVYQLMRTLGLALLGQYLSGPPAADPALLKDREAIAGAIARLRSPYFSDWETLLRTFAKADRCERLGLDVMSGFRAAMDGVRSEIKTAPLAVPREYAMRDGAGRLDLWSAFLALRNHTAHSGQTADQVCREDLALFRAPLDRLLGHFDFLADYEILAADADLARDDTDLACVPLRLLRGAATPEPMEHDLTDDPALCEALVRSPVVMRAPHGRVQPLFPFCHGHLEGEPVRLLDGYYLKDVESAALRHTLYYLGDIRRRALDDGEPVGYPAPCTAGAQLRRMLDAHRVQWHLKREDLALWSIRDSVNDYSRRTVAELGGSKYIPAVYLDRPSLSDPLWRLATADASEIRAGRVRGALLLVGRAGTGKSALLCDLTRRLLERADAGLGEGPEDPTQGQDLVLLLRGDALNPLPGSNQLRANLEQKIGLDPADPARRDLSDALAQGAAVDPAATAIGDTQSIFTALDARRREDQVQGRRLVLLLDGLNEATDDARARVAEALELVELTRHYPWLRVVLALRDEFIAVWHARATGTESSPFARVLDCFEPPPDDPARDPARLGELPAWRVPEFDETQAATVYARYQSGLGIPACTTPWSQIPPETRRGLLLRPLYLHLWMEAFPGRAASPVSGEDALFHAYLDSNYRRFPDLRPSLAAILERMLQTGRSELGADDDRALREHWEREHTERELRLRLNPIETGLAAGILVRRTGADGAGFRIPFQRLREQMLFAHLLEQDPEIRPESLAGWIGLPHSQDLEGALSHIAGVLWDQGRYAELAPLIGAAEVPGRAWERMLAVRLVGEAPPTALQLRALAEGLVDDGARHRLACSLISGVPDRVEGLAAESRRLVLFEMAREILTPLCEREPQRSDRARDLSVSYEKLGDALGTLGRGGESLDYYQRSLLIRKDLHENEPQRSDLARDLAISYSKLGNVLGARFERGGEVLAYHERSFEIVMDLYQKEPQRSDLARDLSVCYEKLGDALGALGRSDEAVTQYERSLEIRKDLHEREPQRSDLARALSVSLEKLGDTRAALGHSGEALAYRKRTLAIRQDLCDREPQRGDLARDLSISYIKLGDALAALGFGAEALEYFQRSVDIRKNLYEREPQRSDLTRDLIAACLRLGQAFHTQGDVERALLRYEEALRLADDWRPRLRATGTLGASDDMWVACLSLLIAAAGSLAAGAVPVGWTVGLLDERPSWRPAPLMAGDWRAVSGSNEDPAKPDTRGGGTAEPVGSPGLAAGPLLTRLESALVRLGLDFTGARITGLRQLALPFYAGPEGVRWTLAEVSLTHEGRAAALALLAGPAGVIPLIGHVHAIYAANALFRPELRTIENRLAYMRFFCAAVHIGQRRPLVDGSDDLPWRDDADPAVRAAAERLIRPLGIVVDAAGYARPHGTVLDGDALFTCNFQLAANGIVHIMTDDKPLLSDLPVRTETFDGPLRWEQSGTGQSGTDHE
jgi:tetratricopeptide (TPR) repeat protein